MSENVILVEKTGNNGAVGIITINRPEVRNALNNETWLQLHAAFQSLDNDPDTRVIIVTGAGDKAFVAGADLNMLKTRSAVETFCGEIPKFVKNVEALSKPTIAMINGFALGGGLELAMACDIRIASDDAKFGQTETNVGILPGYGGSQRLSRLVGLGKAKELIFTGKINPSSPTNYTVKISRNRLFSQSKPCGRGFRSEIFECKLNFFRTNADKRDENP